MKIEVVAVVPVENAEDQQFIDDVAEEDDDDEEEQNPLVMFFLLVLWILDVALEWEVEGDLLLCDMGQGLSLRDGVIDGAISISAFQVNVYERLHLKKRPKETQKEIQESMGIKEGADVEKRVYSPT
ncbi:hypothetical protein GIB67_007987 [Kingdonia uniflora]|uniref:Uncharacterized protein n=1 Tax=Kingdonia uniflora TaxID=39325 RepID=A0A7J7KY61_9MAGN|nr:hypothetical protein GIB67_007987 [Kingdonia uniflora]